MEIYPAEALLAGMRLMQAINLNKKIPARPSMGGIGRQNAHLN